MPSTRKPPRQGREVFYAPCINSDYPYFLERAKTAEALGAKAVHLNIWAGFPAFRSLRDLDLNIAIFFQKSGDKVLSCVDHRYSINWIVVCRSGPHDGRGFHSRGHVGAAICQTPRMS